MTRRLAWVVVLCACGVAAGVRAQEGEPADLPPPEFGPEEGEGGEVVDGPVVEEAPADAPPQDQPDAEVDPEALAEQWDVPRVMVVAARRTPRRLEYQVRELMMQVGDVVSADDYEREARARGLPAVEDAAFEALLPGRDIALVVTVEQRRVRRNRFLRVVYREGRYGMALLTEDHPVSGDRVGDEIGQRIVAEARLALAAITRPRAVSAEGEGASDPSLFLPEEPPSGDRPAPSPGTAVHIGVAAGVGFGMRSFDVPTEPGIVRLSTDPFPAALLRLVVDVEPEAQARFAVGGELRYLSSVGLRSTDRRTDGTERNTSSRSQRLDAEVHARYRLADPTDAVSIGAGLGWGMRSFSSEAPVTLPDYALGGPRLRAIVVLPFADRMELELAPEVVWLVAIDDSLTDHGVSSTAFALGGEARIRVALFGAFLAEASYRESHALLSSPRGDAGDTERYLTLHLLYRP